ncbi:MAG TPA: HAMP domain-containing sensor histidine kinase [Gaiellaceae bacterium]|nr:HAMP domain-containing sensor histidine kinase [Gaiellaceae bacterium]
MSPFRSVGARLALALLIVVAGALGIVYLIAVPSYQRSLENEELRSLASSLEHVALPAFPRTNTDERPLYVSEMAPRVDARVVILDPVSTEGPLEPVEDSSLDQRSDFDNDAVAAAAYRSGRLARGVVTRDGEQFAEVASLVATSGGPSVLLLSSSLHAQLETVTVVRRRVLIAGAVSAVFAILVGYAGASLFARRLRRLEAAAERIAAGDFDEPVVDASEDEVGQLARAFERMRLRLARLDRARGEFIANASHELRTPLFSLAGFLELLDEPGLDAATRDEFVVQMREQVERLTKLATDLLDLSRLDAGRLATAAEAVDLGALATELAAEFAPRAAVSGHLLDVDDHGPAEARGDPERILQIGRVLIENAVVHTPPGTRVRIDAGVDGGRATLAVADDGPGIPPEARAQVFERFFRLDGTRASGSGLGLAIARELADVMGGRIELDERDGWTTFTLALPADAPAAKNVKTAQTAS